MVCLNQGEKEEAATDKHCLRIHAWIFHAFKLIARPQKKSIWQFFKTDFIYRIVTTWKEGAI